VNESRWLGASERWLRLTLGLYPSDFRDEMGEGLVETYRDRCRDAIRRGGPIALGGVWLRALGDALHNGLGERLRPAVGWRRSGNWGRDTERAIRRLVRAPIFTASMVGTLTVGLGAFAVVYAVVDKVLIEPLPYEKPDDLYFVWRDYGAMFDLKRGWLGGTDVLALQEAGGVIEGASALRRGSVTLSTARNDAEGGDPEEIAVIAGSPNLFSLLGVRPILGRGFAPNEEGPGATDIIVLSYDLWQRRFGGDRAVIGREIRINGAPTTVIGVMGPDFHFVRHSSLGSPQGADAYGALAVHLKDTQPGAGSYAGLVRVRPGTSAGQVAAAVNAVGLMVDRRDFESRGLRLWPIGMKEDLVAEVRPALVVLGAAGTLLVLVLAINMANLLLVRAAQRDQEFAILRALGANPAALLRATLLEAGILGLLGGACGALVASWGTRALVALAPTDLPRRESVAVDWRVAAVVLGVGTLLGLLAGAAPAIWTTRTRLSSMLREAAVRGGGGGQGAMRRTMVVAQVALSLVLLTAGGLVARSFEGLLRAKPGFDAAGVLTLRVPSIRTRYPSDTAISDLHGRLQTALAAIPGVKSVGGVSALPLTAEASQSTFGFPGAPGNTGDRDHDRPLIDYMAIRGRYLDALGIRILSGRGFSEGTDRAALREVLIDRQIAEQFFPTGSPLGYKLPIDNDKDSVTIVGVVEHARMYDVHKDGRPQMFFRDEFDTDRSLSFALRTDRDPESLIAEVREAVHRVDPQLAIADIRTMEQIVNEALRQSRVSAVLLSGFSLGALLLAAMGLYGVVAGSVNRRRHEMAVRLALGAEERRVVGLVLREGAVLVVLGLLLGAPGIYLAGRAISSVLVGVSPFDPLTLGAVASGLAVVALFACWVPARRVAGIDPARSLREG